MDSRGLRVLVVDDDPFVQEFLCFQAQHLGCRVTGASTLAEGLAVLASEHYDVVVADANLGSESADPLLDAAEAAGVRTVSVSASPSRRPHTLHLIKPVATEDLARALEARAVAAPPPRPGAGESLVARSQARLNAALDALLDPHVVFAPVRDRAGLIVDYTYVGANRAACVYNGLPKERLLGSRMLGLFPAMDDCGLLGACRAASETGEPQILDDMWLHNDLQGRGRHYDIRIVPLSDELSVTWRDVTAQREAAAATAESEQRYRMLAEYTSDLVARIEHGLVLWVSPSLTRLAGWDTSEVVGRPLAEFVHPDDVALLPLDRPAEELAALIPNGMRVRCRMRYASGDYHWFDVSGGIMRDDEGNYAGVVSSARLIDAEVRASGCGCRSRTRGSGSRPRPRRGSSRASARPRRAPRAASAAPGSD
ncbi:MAG TPA: PAS domain-containing protein [Propionibacteriaceae bacterium]|nr:PAS domain-containing protein [Propionibacteriaceae bacterium]